LAYHWVIVGLVSDYVEFNLT